MPADAPLVLELDLTEPLLAAPPADPVTAIRQRRRSRLTDVLDGLVRAGADDDVAGLIVTLSGSALGLAHAQELHAAVTAFRASGKPTVAWAETYGEFAPGNAGYYLATAFDEVWLQESGDVCLTGAHAEATFLRDALDRIGVTAQIGQRHEYKNAPDMVLRRELSEPHREALTRLVASANEQLAAGIAAGRGLPAERVRELMDGGPLAPPGASDAGLIDRIGYRDQAYDAIRRHVGGRMRLLFLGRYGRSVTDRVRRRVTDRDRGAIAVVYGSGGIRIGRSGSGPGGPSMGSATVAAALRAAARDDDVRAIVFRVDSPGGSYTASDTILREVVLAREAGIPVVVSMGRVAGSGGYFVAMAADAIVALPATLTGSIGVFGGKPVLDGLLSRVGIGTGAVAETAHALMFSPRRGYTEEELATLDRWLDRIYDDFTAKVARHRGLSREQVHEVARGRVWTGADALGHGLVDEMGGIQAALRIARGRADLPARRDVGDVRTFPRLSAKDRLRPPRSSEDPAAAAAVLSGWGTFAGLAGRLGLPAAGPLTMPYGLLPS